MPECEVEEIRVPKESMNDESVLIVAWRAQNGTRVRKDDIIVTVETSKAAFDIEAPKDGYLHYRLKEGEQIRVGELIAVISEKKDLPLDLLNQSFARRETVYTAENSAEGSNKENNGPRFSKTALKIIEEHRLDKKAFEGMAMVTKKEVLSLLAGKTRNSDAKREAEDNSFNLGGAKLLIVGGGGHAKICIDILKQMKTYEIAGIVDDTLPRGERVLGIPVLGKSDILARLFGDGIRHAVNGVGSVRNPVLREKIFNELKQIGFTLPNLIHPRASLEPSVVMGEGNQIMANAVVGAAVRIHNNCIINAGAIVSHDTVLFDNAHIAPGAVLAANIYVGKNTLIGMGATIYLGLKIGDNAVIYNGCNVTQNVPEGKLVRA